MSRIERLAHVGVDADRPYAPIVPSIVESRATAHRKTSGPEAAWPHRNPCRSNGILVAHRPLLVRPALEHARRNFEDEVNLIMCGATSGSFSELPEQTGD
jgi:hypothetical protein